MSSIATGVAGMQTYRLLGIALTQHRKAGSEQYPPPPEYPVLNPGAPSRGDESLPRHPEFSSGTAYEEGPRSNPVSVSLRTPSPQSNRGLD